MSFRISSAILVASTAIFSFNAGPQEASLATVAGRAVAQSRLTLPGDVPFHLEAKIAEKSSPDSDYKADVEIFWESPTKWRRTIESPEFAQTLVVNGGQISEQDSGDYFPHWLQTFVTAIVDPLPMLDVLTRANAQIREPFGSAESISCARFESRVGIAPVQNSAFSVFCFEGSHGLLESVVTPQYAMEFKDYRRSKEKQISRLFCRGAGVTPDNCTTDCIFYVIIGALGRYLARAAQLTTVYLRC